MSEQKRARVAASVDKGMVVGAGNSRRHSAHIRVWSVSVCVFVVLAFLGWGGFEIVHYHDQNAAHSSTYTPHFSSISAAEAAAASASSGGDFSRALADLQSVINLSATTQEKSDLYLQLATSAQNAHNTTLAIQYYQKRHSVDPSSASPDSYTLGVLYQQAGDKSEAIAQYQMYITYFQAHSKTIPPYTPDSVIGPIQAQIQALESSK